MGICQKSKIFKSINSKNEFLSPFQLRDFFVISYEYKDNLFEVIWLKKKVADNLALLSVFNQTQDCPVSCFLSCLEEGFSLVNRKEMLRND